MKPKSCYATINFQVMTDTVNRLKTVPELIHAVESSTTNQYMVAEQDTVVAPEFTECRTRFICSGKRSFEAAKGYPGKRVAVLNYANNHTIGGAPFSAGAQEESLCRCSTLYPCLQAMEVPFYKKHQQDFCAKRLTIMGNDDLVYTPGVVVFKTDERTDPISPVMLPQEEWYKVDIITCAAPEMRNKPSVFPDGYRDLIKKRIKRILDIAACERDEVLILGAWGCGAFGNSLDIVASVFMELLVKYDFETVEFAMSQGDGFNNPFSREIEKLSSKDTEKEQPHAVAIPTTSPEERFCEILRSTGREGIEHVIRQLKVGGFFEAPGSIVHHSNWKGGLLDHSLKVYDCAMKAREIIISFSPEKEDYLPENSVAITTLLHDVCKYDQYTIGRDGKPHHRTPESPYIGHGTKSVRLLQSWGMRLDSSEILAIRWHMGKSGITGKDKDESHLTQLQKEQMEEYEAVLELPIVKLIVNADYEASHS